jgi:hypothetical protein
VKSTSSLLVVLAIAAAAGCDSEAGFPDARIPDATPVPGTFSLSWLVTDPSNGASVSCDDANATSVSITVREVDAGSGQVESFNCNGGAATSRPFPPGTYVLQFALRGPDGEVATAPQRDDIVITSGQDTPIGEITYEVQAQGALSVGITAPVVTSNCGPIAGMGGGIDAMTLTLTKDAACVPFAYTVAAGPETTTTCPATPVACIERTDPVVTAILPSGRYRLDVVGSIAGAACWIGQREARVPTGGATAELTMQLAYQPAVPGCPALP